MKGGEIDTDLLDNVIKNIYNQKDPVKNLDGYELDTDLSKDIGKVYHNKESGHTIVSHRGTQGMSDWLNNVAYATGLYDYTKRNKQGERLQRNASNKYGNDNQAYFHKERLKRHQALLSARQTKQKVQRVET